jgi:endonuclease YncB( thermonuclease family)
VPWFLLACYTPPDLPPFGEVPIVAAPPEGCRDDDEVYVACTVDGDTFDLTSCGEGERVRMLGVDAPETEKPGQVADCYANEAWDWLTGVLTGEEVTVSFDRTCTDIYDRTLAYVWLRDDAFEKVAGDLPFYITNWYEDPDEEAILLNEIMLGEGFARQYPEDLAGTLVFQSRLDEAAKEAEQFSRGLWGACY